MKIRLQQNTFPSEGCSAEFIFGSTAVRFTPYGILVNDVIVDDPDAPILPLALEEGTPQPLHPDQALHALRFLRQLTHSSEWWRLHAVTRVAADYGTKAASALAIECGLTEPEIELAFDERLLEWVSHEGLERSFTVATFLDLAELLWDAESHMPCITPASATLLMRVRAEPHLPQQEYIDYARRLDA